MVEGGTWKGTNEHENIMYYTFIMISTYMKMEKQIVFLYRAI
jgi:hypothetical protein